MITKFNCKCGNNDPRKTKEYDGALGYEAVICLKCGRYYDQEGLHEAETDKNNVLYIKIGGEKMKEYTVLLDDGTTGTVHGRVKEGDKVVVSLADENGMNIFIEGIVKEILEEKEW